MREFWAFRFQHRESEGKTLLQGGRLFNQLAVDCYAAIEQQRLNYIKAHQPEMRADLYQGLEDAVVAGDTDASAVGRRIVLPSSFTGADQDKPVTPEDIDEFICAEIPNKNVDPLAYETVVRSMVHGPCGPHNRNAPCMVDGKCSKHYPKKFSNQTTIDEDGFVSYWRRNKPSNTVTINRVEIDNRWIVPYNRDLLVLFNAHINVEKCASPKSTKYMYKYTYKGIDFATIVIENNVDNPQNNGE
ncbi:hypothetical protein Sango_2950900 [Sesamum angolense]|uniref:Helitron helicase-like domain-containing protein n=1 Tax=Sesamum angolense TaxID=2727404 RepID=A0AAE1T4V1_9LAMI|nr:hypothetical protein Sango_2950900 [Sesamum angolense]